MKKAAIVYLLLLCFALAGCGDRLLERSYSSTTPHSAAYWENEDADTLRAENYQDLVNALLILIGEHNEDGVVRIYGDAPNKAAMAGDACVEAQKETAIGSYLLDYITYEGKTESAYYELYVRFGYRRTVEEQNAIVNATSTEALPDLLRAAIEEGRDAVAIRVGYFGTDRAGVMALVSAVHDEVYPPEETDDAPDEGAEALAPEADTPPDADSTPSGETEPADGSEGIEEPPEPEYDVSPWQVLFYPDDVQPGIVEVILAERNGS